jgi:hypothetical protein
MSAMVKEHLVMFYKSTGGYKPHRIILYRSVHCSLVDRDSGHAVLDTDPDVDFNLNKYSTGFIQ